MIGSFFFLSSFRSLFFSLSKHTMREHSAASCLWPVIDILRAYIRHRISNIIELVDNCTPACIKDKTNMCRYIHTSHKKCKDSSDEHICIASPHSLSNPLILWMCVFCFVFQTYISSATNMFLFICLDDILFFNCYWWFKYITQIHLPNKKRQYARNNWRLSI